MGNHRSEIWYRKGVSDPAGKGLCSDTLDLGIKGVERIEVGSIYLIKGTASKANLARIARELLIDPITQVHFLGRRRQPKGAISVEVWFKEGVTDTVGETARKGIEDLGVSGVLKVSTARRYFLYGKRINKKNARLIASRLLANEVIQTFKIT